MQCQRKHWGVHKKTCHDKEERKIRQEVARETTVKDCNMCKTSKAKGEWAGRKLQSCCHLARYCSTECQHKDWPEHKKVCERGKSTVINSKGQISKPKVPKFLSMLSKMIARSGRLLRSVARMLGIWWGKVVRIST